MPQRNCWLDDLRLTLSAANAFGEKPPFVNIPFGYDTANADLYGRVVSMQLTKGWKGE
jgi:hypothetical protein